MFLLVFVAVETGASEPLPSKMTSASAVILELRQYLPSRCLAIDYYVIYISILRPLQTLFYINVKYSYLQIGLLFYLDK